METLTYVKPQRSFHFLQMWGRSRWTDNSVATVWLGSVLANMAIIRIKRFYLKTKQKPTTTTTTTEHLKNSFAEHVHVLTSSWLTFPNSLWPLFSQLLALNNRHISVKVVWLRDVERTLNDSLCLIPVCRLVIIAFVAGNISVLINHLSVEVHQSWPFSFFFTVYFPYS